jgi:hypothetical protein
MTAGHEMPPSALYFALRASLTAEWQSTHTLRAVVSRGRTHRPALSDVAATLRRLRRDGCAERVSKGINGHYWRVAE